MFSEESLQKLRKLYEADGYLNMTDEEVLAGAISLYNIVEAVYKPVEKKEYFAMVREEEARERRMTFLIGLLS